MLGAWPAQNGNNKLIGPVLKATAAKWSWWRGGEDVEGIDLDKKPGLHNALVYQQN